MIDHYKRAEMLLQALNDTPDDAETHQLMIAVAQVHASLDRNNLLRESLKLEREMSVTQRDVYQLAAERIKQPETTVPADEALHTHSGIVVPWPPSEELKEAVARRLFEWGTEDHHYPKPSWQDLSEAQRDRWYSGAHAVLDAIHKQVSGDE